MNGKALVAGIRLEEMTSTDMVDVIHYFFESDLTSDNPEFAEAKSDVRSLIYENLYGVPYKYSIKGKSTGKNSSRYPGGFSSDLPKPFNPNMGGSPEPVRKPYVPATDFDDNSYAPYGDLLDPPLM